MAEIEWHTVGEKMYEGGIDHGVLYVGDNPGVPWNGIAEVSDEPTGGESEPHYIDGVKFLNESAPEDFEATLSAFYSPPEFDVCDGAWYLREGIYATQQKRQKFGLAYRTKIGNDLEGLDHGYKIHLVYNATAQPTTRRYGTLTASPSAEPLSWKITTQPLLLGGVVWAAHIVIDSLTTHPGVLAQLEDILYGTPVTDPRLPTPQEIVGLVGIPLGIDGGFPDMPQTELLDGGHISELQTEVVDGGEL